MSVIFSGTVVVLAVTTENISLSIATQAQRPVFKSSRHDPPIHKENILPCVRDTSMHELRGTNELFHPCLQVQPGTHPHWAHPPELPAKGLPAGPCLKGGS